VAAHTAAQTAAETPSPAEEYPPCDPAAEAQRTELRSTDKEIRENSPQFLLQILIRSRNHLNIHESDAKPHRQKLVPSKVRT
jgi:hypothetical protein